MRFLPEHDQRRQVWRQCESPIEQILCTALFAYLGLEAVVGDFSTERIPELVRDQPTAFLFAQQSIAGYRVDFLVVVADREGCVLFAIECDGRDYHSSEDQRAYDQRRDAVLLSAGCREVLRISGNLIVRSPHHAADYVYAAFHDLGVEATQPPECRWWRSLVGFAVARPHPYAEVAHQRFEEELATIRRFDATWM